jgi:hypothetical protein
MSYEVIVHPDVLRALEAYRAELVSGAASPGERLATALSARPDGLASREGLLDALLATKPPQLFAESAVRADGTDWNLTELSLLGDVGVAVPVTVFDDGRHTRPRVHPEPFQGWLLFMPGPLLRNDTGGTPADWSAVVAHDVIDPDRYDALIARRLLPLLTFASERALSDGRRAMVTLPGVGCGQFAGPFRGSMGSHLARALRGLLARHGARLKGLRAVHFDPYSECANRYESIGEIAFRVRPLLRGNESLPQLCPPAHYAVPGEDFSDCTLFSVVAWDHVSWPGNDYWIGSRVTDDGVKAAATDAMRALTGVEGTYDPVHHGYVPPSPHGLWIHVAEALGLTLSARGRLRVLPAPGA